MNIVILIILFSLFSSFTTSLCSSISSVLPKFFILPQEKSKFSSKKKEETAEERAARKAKNAKFQGVHPKDKDSPNKDITPSKSPKSQHQEHQNANQKEQEQPRKRLDPNAKPYEPPSHLKTEFELKKEKIQSERLPIDDQKEMIKERMNSDNVLIIRGDTGRDVGFWNVLLGGFVFLAARVAPG